VDAPADAVARLEHRHLVAAGGERIGRREPGEAGADDDDPSASPSDRHAFLASEKRG
jgi:hypothetical protein